MINSHHPTIKFTYEYHTKEIPFLDTIVCKTKNNKLFTRAYHKPTDNKQYLHFHSAHPRKQEESVPYGLLIRSRRICSEEKYFEERARKIIQQLKHRKLRLITNYNPNNPDLRSVLKKYEGILLMTRKPAIKPEDIQVTNNKISVIKT